MFAVLALGVLGLPACSTVDRVKSAIQDIHRNKTVVDSFNSKLNTAPTTFEANYTTSGSAPATVNYAAQLLDDVAFTLTPHRGKRGHGAGPPRPELFGPIRLPTEFVRAIELRQAGHRLGE